VAFPAYNISPYYPINFTISLKKILNVKRSSIFSTTVKNLSFEEELNEIFSYMCIVLNVKYKLLFSYFNET